MSLLTIQAVADDLACSRKHVRRIIAAGDLPIIATGETSRGDRVDPVALEAYKQRKQRNRGVPHCPSTNVTAFGTRVPRSVENELNDLLGPAPIGKKRRNSKRRSAKDFGTTATPNG